MEITVNGRQRASVMWLSVEHVRSQLMLYILLKIDEDFC